MLNYEKVRLWQTPEHLIKLLDTYLGAKLSQIDGVMHLYKRYNSL